MKMLFSTVLCLMLPLSAYAQDVRSLAVLPAQNVGLDESTAEIFNELFIAQLGSMAERRIITMRDIEAMLGFEQTKQAFDCSEMSCLAEIGGSLGVDELLYPRVTGIGDELMLSFTLMDVSKAEVLARSSITIDNDPKEYRKASERVLADLWKSAGFTPAPAKPVAAAPAPASVLVSVLIVPRLPPDSDGDGTSSFSPSPLYLVRCIGSLKKVVRRLAALNTFPASALPLSIA